MRNKAMNALSAANMEALELAKRESQTRNQSAQARD